jgi:hypothetical protein
MTLWWARTVRILLIAAIGVAFVFAPASAHAMPAPAVVDGASRAPCDGHDDLPRKADDDGMRCFDDGCCQPCGGSLAMPVGGGPAAVADDAEARTARPPDRPARIFPLLDPEPPRG